jgi:hypothetical protein
LIHPLTEGDQTRAMLSSFTSMKTVRNDIFLDDQLKNKTVTANLFQLASLKLVNDKRQCLMHYLFSYFSLAK